MIEWLKPEQCWPPHGITHPDKLADLITIFKERGWGYGYEALVGYMTYDCQRHQWGLQLLSGSHRWAAAIEAGIRIPVVVLSDETVERAWGHPEMWRTLMGMGRSHMLHMMRD
jgi:hypothetical protein